MKFFVLIFKNVRRNLLRSILTALSTMVLVVVMTGVWSILWLLDRVTEDKKANFKAMVTEKWSIPSRLPFSYAEALRHGAKDPQDPDAVEPLDWMTWQFFGGTIEKGARPTRQNMIFAIGVDPDKVLTMMEGLDNLPPEEAKLLEQYVDIVKVNRRGIILGMTHFANIFGRPKMEDLLRKSLAKYYLEKYAGSRITIHGIGNFKGLDLEFEIVGIFPPGRYDTLAAFHCEYLNAAFDAYEREHKRKHPLADRSVNLVLLKVKDSKSFNRLAHQIETSPYFTNPAVKVETFSAGMAAFLDAFRDLVWFLRWPLGLASLGTLSLVIANAISISVRERRKELAVLKVLGFSPDQLLALVLGEALLLGAGAGFLSAALTYAGVNFGLGGIQFPIGFFDRFFIPKDALWWGPAMGGGAALLGSFVPAWSARNVKVADVFAKVA